MKISIEYFLADFGKSQWQWHLHMIIRSITQLLFDILELVEDYSVG